MCDPALTVSKSDPNYWEVMYTSLSNEKTYWKNKTVEQQATITELEAELDKMWKLVDYSGLSVDEAMTVLAQMKENDDG